MVAVNTLYNVGARDEHPELTGMAHLFEHLMFGGSVNVEDFDGELSAAGGVSNAWTSNDFTNFYDILPAVNIETALWLESDRMLQLGFSENHWQCSRASLSRNSNRCVSTARMATWSMPSATWPISRTLTGFL